MDRAYIERENVIERYLQGRLDSGEASEFEIYMLEHPETAEALEYARGLQAGMSAAHGEFFLAQTRPMRPLRPMRLIAALWPARRYAATCGMLIASLAVTSGYLYHRSNTLSTELAALRGPASVTAEIWLEPVRGEAAVILEKAPGEAILLRAIVDASSVGPFRIDLFRLGPIRIGQFRIDPLGIDGGEADEGADGEPIWSQSGVRADAEPSVVVFARDLPFGAYRLVVTSEPDGTVAADYALELTRGSPDE